MDSIPGIRAIMIPIVAIFAYVACERRQEGEEKRRSVQVEVGDDIRGVNEQLMRIEKLLREGEEAEHSASTRGAVRGPS